jgi:hypothetical protein
VECPRSNNLVCNNHGTCVASAISKQMDELKCECDEGWGGNRCEEVRESWRGGVVVVVVVFSFLCLTV